MWHFGVSSEAAEMIDDWPDSISAAGFIAERIKRAPRMTPSSEEESQWLDNLAFFTCNSPLPKTPTAARESIHSATGLEAECVLLAGQITIFDNDSSKYPLHEAPL